MKYNFHSWVDNVITLFGIAGSSMVITIQLICFKYHIEGQPFKLYKLICAIIIFLFFSIKFMFFRDEEF